MGVSDGEKDGEDESDGIKDAVGDREGPDDSDGMKDSDGEVDGEIDKEGSLERVTVGKFVGNFCSPKSLRSHPPIGLTSFSQ